MIFDWRVVNKAVFWGGNPCSLIESFPQFVGAIQPEHTVSHPRRPQSHFIYNFRFHCYGFEPPPSSGQKVWKLVPWRRRRQCVSQKHKQPFPLLQSARTQTQIPQISFECCNEKAKSISGCCEKVRGNTDVPEAWSDSSKTETKLEQVSINHCTSLCKTTQCFMDINIRFYGETNGTDSHLAPFHTIT
jgi:hypothetical protein